MKKKINVGLIGCGFMGRAHSNAYRKVSQFFELGYEPVLKVVCDSNKERVKKFSDNWGWQSTETDWQKVIDREDVDLIDICVPNNTHCEIVLAAAKAGKIICCEKPLAMNIEEGQAMVEEVEKAGKANMVWYNYRRVPAVALAKKIIEDGKLGRIFHYRAKYLQDWTISPDVPQGGQALWRLDINSSGSGVTGDLLSHSIDTAMWLMGPISSVCAMTETFIKQRPLQEDLEKIMPVKIDDACAFLARFRNGALGTFESTRYACGRKNQNTFEINGEKGSVYFDLENAHELGYFNHGDESEVRGWRNIQVWDSDHPYMKNWWVPGCAIGYEHTFIHTLADFLAGLEKAEKRCPDFRDALATQYICDMVLSSAKNKTWETAKSQ
ncbi:MAG: Gfo/Idh/MocA family protein [Planctomycetota bacterium]|jgi:predicted dehydrogenase